jgi:hypothetical protein
MKENQRGSLYRFDEGRNQKFYNLARMLRHYYEHVSSLKKGKNNIKPILYIYFLNDAILIPFDVKNVDYTGSAKSTKGDVGDASSAQPEEDNIDGQDRVLSDTIGRLPYSRDTLSDILDLNKITKKVKKINHKMILHV